MTSKFMFKSASQLKSLQTFADQKKGHNHNSKSAKEKAERKKEKLDQFAN